MALVGYARVSSKDQNLAVQIGRLEDAGVEKLYEEKASGTAAKRSERVELDRLLDFIREGDTVVVTRLDRLARSLRDLHKIAGHLEEKNVGLRVLEQNIDTTTAEGRLFFNILGSIGEFETELRKARQQEGIDAAKRRPDNPYKGRPPSFSAEAVFQMKSEGIAVTEIAKTLGCHRQTVWRMLKTAA